MFIVRSMDCNAVHDGNFCINRPNGYDCLLILFVKTEAVFTINGVDMTVQPNTFVMFDKFSPQHYRASGNEYVNDWIQAECTVEQFGEICGKPVFIGDKINIGGYMKLIGDAFFRNGRSACSMLLEAMLTEVNELTENTALGSPHYRDLLDLRHEIYTGPSPEHNIKTIASRLHISEPYLQELYKKTFGVSIGADIIAGRVDTAKRMLLDTELTAAEIGYRCGYNSPVHFSRQFAGIVGLPPAEWRKRNS